MGFTFTATRTDGHGIPVVTRRVRASFSYSADLVSLNRLTSDGYEFPKPSDDHEKRAALQDEVLSKTKAQIEEGASRHGLPVPVVVGWLRPLGNPAGDASDRKAGPA